MPNDILTLDYVTDEIGIRLGGTGVMVELTEKDILSCLSSAITLYNRFLPQRAKASINVNSTQKKYLVEHPNLLGIVDVSFVDKLREGISVDPFDPLSYLGGAEMTRAGDTFGQLDFRLQYLEDSRRITGADPDWTSDYERDEEGNPAYYLYVDIRRPMLCSYTFTWRVSCDDDPMTGLRWIPEGSIEWVLDYTLARAKIILSRIRGKFGGITGPDGSDQTIDAQELASEGREEETKLKEEIELWRRPLAPELG